MKRFILYYSQCRIKGGGRNRTLAPGTITVGRKTPKYKYIFILNTFVGYTQNVKYI